MNCSLLSWLQSSYRAKAQRSISELCAGQKKDTTTAPFRMRSCRSGPPEKGKLKPFQKTCRETRDIFNFSKCCFCYPRNSVKNTHPDIVLFKEQMNPAIQRGYRNRPLFANLRYRLTTVQIGVQNMQDESQCVGTVGNQRISQQRMRVPAGLAANSWYVQLNLTPLIVNNRYHHYPVTPRAAAPTYSAAGRTLQPE